MFRILVQKNLVICVLLDNFFFGTFIARSEQNDASIVILAHWSALTVPCACVIGSRFKKNGR